MTRIVGVVRSPFASPGQVVDLDETDPRVAHYLAGGVLALVHDDVDESEPVEGGADPTEEQPRDPETGQFVSTDPAV